MILFRKRRNFIMPYRMTIKLWGLVCLYMFAAEDCAADKAGAEW